MNQYTYHHRLFEYLSFLFTKLLAAISNKSALYHDMVFKALNNFMAPFNRFLVIVIVEPCDILGMIGSIL